MSIVRKVITVEAEINTVLNKRYFLKKSWAESGEETKRFVVIMHNPNVADEIKGDKSSNLCLNKAVDAGCNELVVVNLYATRGPESKQLASEDKIYDNKNKEAIKEAISKSEILLLAWGDNPGPMVEADDFIQLLVNFNGDIKCFGKNQSGEPSHPRNKGEFSPLIDFSIADYYNLEF